MSNLVVVAIPAESDEIWNVSSEQVPHMTILFLGDADSNPNVSRISETVRGLASNYLQPFSLRVDHRGLLGPDLADVLFFANDIPDPLMRFRSRCLDDVNIRSAYNSLPQRTDWVPHITLGYPTTPARKADVSNIPYVTFDRIAVWNNDYSGPTFTLIDNRPIDVASDSVAWSDWASNFLYHHGVKGMRWGVRRARGKDGRVVSEDAARARAASDKKKKSGLDSLDNHELQALVNRMNLEQSLKRLEANEPKTVAQKGIKLTADILANVAKQQTTKLANDAAAKQVESLLSKKK